MMGADVVCTVSEFVALLNQTLDYAYQGVTITGELTNFKVSKNRWVYFDLKDDESSVRFFGTVYQLPGPLEDGMLVAVKGAPRMHPQYGFSVNVVSIRPMGEGAIKKAAALLEAQLAQEGLFDIDRKRGLPYPPARIGLITSAESAAYRDFVKVLAGRWGGVEIVHVDVQVQGDPAVAEVCAAIEHFNQLADAPEVIVITRGGGSADDLQAFSTEQVTRAVAASRIPTLVAIGHEVDVSLAELAADQRASTPSNAAELLVPDRAAERERVRHGRERLEHGATYVLRDARHNLIRLSEVLGASARDVLARASTQLAAHRQLLAAYNPQAALERGYALVHGPSGGVVHSGRGLRPGNDVVIELSDARVTAGIKQVSMKET